MPPSGFIATSAAGGNAWEASSEITRKHHERQVARWRRNAQRRRFPCPPPVRRCFHKAPPCSRHFPGSCRCAAICALMRPRQFGRQRDAPDIRTAPSLAALDHLVGDHHLAHFEQRRQSARQAHRDHTLDVAMQRIELLCSDAASPPPVTATTPGPPTISASRLRPVTARMVKGRPRPGRNCPA